MTFEQGAWAAAVAGALAGAVFHVLRSSPLPPSFRWVDRAMVALTVAFGAFLLYSLLALVEGWAALFQRPASPVVPLGVTLAILLAGVGGAWLRRRRREPAPTADGDLPPVRTER